MPTIVSTLYPPLIETFMPAFPYLGPAPVSFSFSPYNSLNDIKKIHVSLVNQKTNQSAFENNSKALVSTELQEKYNLLNNIWILDFDINGTENLTVNTANNTCTISIPKELLKGDKNGFVIDNYYKVQIRFDNSTAEASSTTYLTNNRQFFSEWSSVCLIKAVPTVELGMVGFDDQTEDVEEANIISRIRTVQAGTVPIAGSVVFSYESSISTSTTNDAETLQRYRITIASDDTGEEIDKTKDWVYTAENENPNKIYWLADVTNAQPDEMYNVYIEGYTKNQYYFDKTYQLKIANFDATSFTPIWDFQTVQLDEYNDSVDKIVTEEDGMVTFTITSKEEMPQGFLYVKRATSLDNFKNWELISCTSNFGKVDITITDPTVGSMAKYRYACQYRLKKNGNFTETKYSEIEVEEEGIIKKKAVYVYPDFYDVLVYRDGRQIALRYNTQIQSYSAVVNRQVINTLGSKYPKFAENAQMNYKKFTITGLITTESDFNRKFINDREYASEMQDYDKYMDGKYEVRNDTVSDNTFTYTYSVSEQEYPDTKNATKHLTPNTLHDLYPKDNWWLERKFREEALAWLNDGEPKLFRSMTEGNLIVMLTDISLTPNAQLGRRTYNISMTAYEVGDGYSLDVLSSLGIISVPDEYTDYINSSQAQEDKEEEEESGKIEETVIGQLYSKKSTGTTLVDDNNDRLVDKADVNTYTIDNYYNGLYYQGINSNYKVSTGSYRLKDLRIQFESLPQWYDVFNNTLQTSNSNKNNLIYGYKLELKVLGQPATTVFVEEKGYYQVPSNLIITDVRLFDDAVATLDYKLTYSREYDESSVPSAAEISQKIVGQIGGRWNREDKIADKIKNKYEYYSTTTEKKGFNGLLEKQYMDKITAFGFDGTTYATFKIIFEDDEDGNEYVVGRTGVYNLMTDYPIEDVIFLGRRMFRKDNPDYNDYRDNSFNFDPSTAGYQATPIDSLGWYDIDNGGQALDVLVVINNHASTPERNQIVRNFIDAETEMPYNSTANIPNPKKNTIYGVYENDDVILMLYTKEGQWVQVELTSDGSHTIIGIDINQDMIVSGKKKFFLEEWEFSLDESAQEIDDEYLVWYKTFLGSTGTPVQINGTPNINHYITDINGDIVIPAIDGYLSTDDIIKPEYNIVYGFNDGTYKIYYIDQHWYNVEFIDPQQQIILVHVPVYGMVNYRGNVVKIKYD